MYTLRGLCPDALLCVVKCIWCRRDDHDQAEPCPLPAARERVCVVVNLSSTCSTLYALVFGDGSFRATSDGRIWAGSMVPHRQCFHWLRDATDVGSTHIFSRTARAWVADDVAYCGLPVTKLQQRILDYVYVAIFLVYGMDKRSDRDAVYLCGVLCTTLQQLRDQVTRVPVYSLMFNAILSWLGRLAESQSALAQRELQKVDRAEFAPLGPHGMAVSGNSGSPFHRSGDRTRPFSNPYRQADFDWHPYATCALLRLFACQVVGLPRQQGPLAAQWAWWEAGQRPNVQWSMEASRSCSCFLM